MNRSLFLAIYTGLMQADDGALILQFDVQRDHRGQAILLLGWMVPGPQPFRILAARDDGGVSAIVTIRSLEFDPDGIMHVKLATTMALDLPMLNSLHRKHVMVDARSLSDPLCEDDIGDGVVGLMRQPGRGDAVQVMAKSGKRARALET